VPAAPGISLSPERGNAGFGQRYRPRPAALVCGPRRLEDHAGEEGM